MKEQRKTFANARRPAKVLIVDDHPLMREGLTVRIAAQPDMSVCGEAASLREALVEVKATAPDMAIVDIGLSESHGLDLIRELNANHPAIRILVVSAYDEGLYAERALRAGAHGYINKQQCQDDLIHALRVILKGERYLSPKMTQQLVGQAIGSNAATGSDPIHRLTDRELEVFQLIGAGKTTGGIARQLHLSVHTIETHREKIRHKLCLTNGAELTRSAMQYGLEQRLS